MSVKNLPQFQQPREKLYEQGAESLSDIELLMLLIQSGSKNNDVQKIAKKLLPSGTFQDLQTVELRELKKIKGLGRTKASVVLAAYELSRRLYASYHVPKIQSSEDVLKLVSFITTKKKEHVVAIYLDARQQLIKTEVVSVGSIDVSIAHPREIFEPALRYHASNIIVAHNHPSGDPTPSEADIFMTQKLMKAGHILGIHIIDHIIVAKNGFTSLQNVLME